MLHKKSTKPTQISPSLDEPTPKFKDDVHIQAKPTKEAQKKDVVAKSPIAKEKGKGVAERSKSVPEETTRHSAQEKKKEKQQGKKRKTELNNLAITE